MRAAGGIENPILTFDGPDIELRMGADGQLEVEIRGVDVYDPTTGRIRSSSTDEIDS